MKYFTQTELVKCFCEKKQDRCAECLLKGPVKKLPQGVEEALEALVVNVLDPAREEIKRPVFITSAFRCPNHNTKVGSKPTSQHIKGEAADIYVGTPEENLELAKILAKQNRFDQMILYTNSPDSLAPRFIHVSYKRPSTLRAGSETAGSGTDPNRHRILKQVAGTTGYEVVPKL